MSTVAPLLDVLSKGQDALARIQAWEHWDAIREVAWKEYQIPQKEFNRLLPEYQKFLALNVIGYRGLGMFSVEVDQIWHSHILHTYLYAEFCGLYNGELIHHIPQCNPKPANDCSTCQSCIRCNTKCKNCQGKPRADEHAHAENSTLDYFVIAYGKHFGRIPTLWIPPIAQKEFDQCMPDGIAE